MPELRQLQTFVAVAEELNFTRAAARLHVAQQAVSKSVQQLERRLGVELLERTTREVRLTAAGAVFLAGAREALAAVDAAVDAARAAAHGLTGTVVLGVTPAIGASVVAEAVRALRDGAPDLGVRTREVRPVEIGPLLRSGEVAGVLARTLRQDPSVDSAPLRPTPAVLAVPAGHRLAGRAAVALAELDGERLLLASGPGSPYTDMVLTRLAAAGVTVQPVESKVTGSGLPGELVRERAVTLTAEGRVREAGVVHVPLAPEGFDLPLRLAWRAGRPSPVVARLRDALG